MPKIRGHLRGVTDDHHDNGEAIVDDSADDSAAETIGVEIPAPADWLSEGLAAAGASEPELETITSEDVGSIDVLDLEADSPLELGEAIKSPFEDEKSAEGQA